ncbi:MAG: OmpA family protein [Hyphomonadaceae bacterium]|nr:OmpA family protein [Hyphomonadaceae bacterium]
MNDDLDPNESPERRLLLLGVFGVVVMLLLGMLGPHQAAVWRMPQVLEERAGAALAAAGLGGLEVVADGQALILRGVVENEEDVAAAERLALTSSGPGGAWAGGVTRVDISDVSLGVFERPYAWSARRDGPRLVLSGPTPSQSVRESLLATARDALPTAEIVDELRIAGGAASPAFADLARQAVRSLAGLSMGEARIVDEQVAFIGDGGAAAVDALRQAFADPPAPYKVRIAVTVDGLDLENPQLQGLNLSSGDANTCDQAFERLMEGNVINFATGSAAIDPSSRPILDSLASVALRCDRFQIEVAGHTDSEGTRESNLDLSRRRADAVADYLAGQGVGPSRLVARGYGAERPRASNATAEGQAANRRIEFHVRPRNTP